MKVTIHLASSSNDVGVALDVEMNAETYERLASIVANHDEDISYDCSLSLWLTTPPLPEPVEMDEQFRHLVEYR